MSIAVSVLTTKQVARNNCGGVRQDSNPQSATAYSFGRCMSTLILGVGSLKSLPLIEKAEFAKSFFAFALR
jgi:hypothetical protein